MRIEEIGGATLINGDCRVVMAAMDENSVDSIVCDPPYGLSFMGKGWDHGVPSKEFWVEALRVAKPGAYLLAFGGTRTHHRLMVAIEDAGWEIRDCVMWVYGSGFPKSHNGAWGGTALKPAWEPIILARKHLIGIVAANVQQYGTGGLNIDACRVPVDVVADASQIRTMERGQRTDDTSGQVWGLSKNGGDSPQVVRPDGRWPANLIHDGSDEVLACFPDSKGQQGDLNETGRAARFFYCAKASRKDRNEGLDDKKGNAHATVKPTALMRYLCRLVTPPGGTILDPFMGSGSTGKAALLEGFKFVGIELDEEHGYFDIALARIAHTTGNPSRKC